MLALRGPVDVMQCSSSSQCRRVWPAPASSEGLAEGDLRL
jgi:hypothetical protein